MVGALALIVIVGTCTAAAIAGFAWAWNTWRNRGDRASYDGPGLDMLLGIGGGLTSVIIGLLILAMATGDWSSVPTGCYRISRTTSSGTAVTVGPKGAVGVTPIILSGTTYEPIACPS